MRTRSAKQAAKRVGRKLNPGLNRYPSGAAKHESQEQIMETAVQARQRVFGLTKDEAKTKEMGTAVGRLAATGMLGSKTQATDLVEAAFKFLARKDAADRALLSQPLTTSTNYVDGRGGYDGLSGDEPGYVEQCETARRRYAEVRRAVLECGDSFAMFAIEQVVVEDREPKADHMLGSLRCGLNAIHRVLKSSRK